MPSVGLIVTKPKLVFGNNEATGREGWRLSFDGALANSYRQHVDLTTPEEKFTNLVGTVAFEDDAKEAYGGHAKGSLTYWKGSDDAIFPHPPSWLATIRLAANDLETLTRTVRQGLPLISVNITVPGMDYDWEPDGSGKKWDNAANPTLAIEAFRLFFGAAEEEEIAPDPPETAVQTDIKSLVAVRELGQTMRYILYVTIALAVIVLLRR